MTEENTGRPQSSAFAPSGSKFEKASFSPELAREVTPTSDPGSAAPPIAAIAPVPRSLHVVMSLAPPVQETWYKRI